MSSLGYSFFCLFVAFIFALCAVNSSGTRVTDGLCHLIWVLGAKLGSSVRTICVVDC